MVRFLYVRLGEDFDFYSVFRISISTFLVICLFHLFFFKCFHTLHVFVQNNTRRLTSPSWLLPEVRNLP
ncbi:hypothetical protein JHK87_002919 [Glycine soja]|nr:hypothetical protein JHK87_002919 [Glycine soja]